MRLKTSSSKYWWIVGLGAALVGSCLDPQPVAPVPNDPETTEGSASNGAGPSTATATTATTWCKRVCRRDYDEWCRGRYERGWGERDNLGLSRKRRVGRHDLCLSFRRFGILSSYR